MKILAPDEPMRILAPDRIQLEMWRARGTVRFRYLERSRNREARDATVRLLRTVFDKAGVEGIKLLPPDKTGWYGFEGMLPAEGLLAAMVLEILLFYRKGIEIGRS